MDEQAMQQLVQGIAQALEQGVPPEQIAQQVSQQTQGQISPEDAMQMVQEVAQQMQGGGQGQGGGVTAEQALEAFQQIGLNEEQILQTIQILTQMPKEEVERLVGALQGGGQGGQPQQEEAPTEEGYDEY